MKKIHKKTLISMMLLPILSAGFANADMSIERLSLFLDDGTSVYENRQLIDSKNTFPPELEVNFEEKEINGEKIWQWKIINNSSKAFKNLKLTGLIDVDIDAQQNTFFNEFGQLVSLKAPSGYIPPKNWEVDELGYYDGKLARNIIERKGLSNKSTLQENAINDDVSIAMSLDIKNLNRNEELNIYATLANDPSNGGTVQKDNHKNNYQQVFNFYAQQSGSSTYTPFTLLGGLKTTGHALKDGEVWVWGYRNNGLQGNGVDFIPVNVDPNKVNNLGDIVSVSAGIGHFVALNSNGDVYTWGTNSSSVSGCNVNANIINKPCKVISNIKQVAAGDVHTLVLDKNGDVWSWGYNSHGQVSGPLGQVKLPKKVNLGSKKVRLIGSGSDASFAVTEDNEVWGWGANSSSVLDQPGGMPYPGKPTIINPVKLNQLTEYAKNIKYIASGDGWAEALLEDGRVIGWGAVSALGINEKNNRGITKPIEIIKNIKQLYARNEGSVALTNQGEVYTWGMFNGNPREIFGLTPTKRETFGKVINIGGGLEHINYQTEDGKLYGVGINASLRISNQERITLINWPGKILSISE